MDIMFLSLFGLDIKVGTFPAWEVYAWLYFIDLCVLGMPFS